MSKKAFRLLLGDRVVGYHPIVAKVSGGAAEGVLLSQLLYWEQKMEAARGPSWDGWFYKVAREIYEETGMTRVEFQTARANLIKRGFVEYKSRGVPMKAHYRIDIDKLSDALESAEEFSKAHSRKFLEKGQTAYGTPTQDVVGEDSETQDTAPQFVHNGHVHNEQVENGQASMPITDISDCPKSANQFVQNVQTIQEITTLDYQKNNKIEETAFSKSQIQTEIKSLFKPHPEFEWKWLDALLLEIPDPALHLTIARRLFGVGKSNAVFDPATFSRMVRFENGRQAAQPTSRQT